MDHFSDGQVMRSLDATIQAVVRELHRAIEHKDALRIGELVAADVFVFGAAADAVSIGRDQLVAELCREFQRLRGKELRQQTSEVQVGLCDSGRSAWFLDRCTIDVAGDQDAPRRLLIRTTGLLTLDHEWRLAAAYWSIPILSNEYQYALLEAGKIPPGLALEDHVAPQAQSLAQYLRESLAEPHTLPELYSTREDTFTIGSTVDEVFRAAEGRQFIQAIVGLPLRFAMRGGIRSAVAPDGRTAWMATHVDLSGGLTMPYRFFFVWLREGDAWKIVVSHDAASVDPADLGFDGPPAI